MSGPLRLVQWLFHQLYTTFYFLYDLVAWLVSFGEWRAWAATATAFAHGDVLEIGHGPGHVLLQLQMRAAGKSQVAGIDLSAQMTRLAAAKLHSAGFGNAASQASAGRLPFASGTFDSVVSTFPAPYIFEPGTLRELHRVLKQHGVLVVVPHAKLQGTGVGAVLLRWLYAATGQRLAAEDKVRERFASAGLTLTVETRNTRHAVVTLWLMRKIG